MYICEKCGKSCKSLTALTSHIENHDEETFDCSISGKVYVSRSSRKKKPEVYINNYAKNQFQNSEKQFISKGAKLPVDEQHDSVECSNLAKDSTIQPSNASRGKKRCNTTDVGSMVKESKIQKEDSSNIEVEAHVNLQCCGKWYYSKKTYLMHTFRYHKDQHKSLKSTLSTKNLPSNLLDSM